MPCNSNTKSAGLLRHLPQSRRHTLQFRDHVTGEPVLSCPLGKPTSLFSPFLSCFPPYPPLEIEICCTSNNHSNGNRKNPHGRAFSSIHLPLMLFLKCLCCDFSMHSIQPDVCLLGSRGQASSRSLRWKPLATEHRQASWTWV